MFVHIVTTQHVDDKSPTIVSVHTDLESARDMARRYAGPNIYATVETRILREDA